MSHTGKVLAALLLVLGHATLARANVTLINGNFFIGYTDVVYPGGLEPKVERIYNSKSAFKGMFGWGWGNNLDVYITTAADGTLFVHEYGGGSQNHFVPEGSGNELPEAQINFIVRAAADQREVTSDAEASAMREKLRSDRDYLNTRWQDYKNNAPEARNKYGSGTVFYSFKYGNQYITRLANGYVRRLDSGRYEYFDDSGHLTRISDPNNNYIKINYDSNGRISTLVDNHGRQMIFTVNSRGLTERIKAETGVSLYRYNDRDELIYNRDVDGNVYRYGYSEDARHNLTQISYQDGTTMEMTYHDRDKYENIKSVKERDGSVTLYDYSFGPGVPRDVKVEVTEKKKDGSVSNKMAYEFFYKYDEVGKREYLYKRIKTTGASKEVLEVNEEGKLVAVQSEEKNVRYTHDRGRVIKKETNEEIVDITYDEKTGKMTLATYRSKTNPVKVISNKFTYDLRGNLQSVEASTGKSVTLKNDDAGRVVVATFSDKRQLQFTYGEGAGGPVEIQLTSGGRTRKIIVEYLLGREPEKKGEPQDISEIEAANKELTELVKLSAEATALNDECNVCSLDSFSTTP